MLLGSYGHRRDSGHKKVHDRVVVVTPHARKVFSVGQGFCRSFQIIRFIFFDHIDKGYLIILYKSSGTKIWLRRSTHLPDRKELSQRLRMHEINRCDFKIYVMSDTERIERDCPTSPSTHSGGDTLSLGHI